MKKIIIIMIAISITISSVYATNFILGSDDFKNNIQKNIIQMNNEGYSKNEIKEDIELDLLFLNLIEESEEILNK